MTDRFMDGYDDPWGPAGRYGGKLVNWMVQSRAGVSVDDLGEAVPEEKFNNEGEKQMEKIDWHKPLRLQRYAVRPGGEDPQVKTYKSGRQRVVWVDERVYPVDDQGRAMADVTYPGGYRVRRGATMVENAPEEKFFVGLARNLDGTYWLTDGGMVSDTGTMNYWKKLMGSTPHRVVDTRKSAEPPPAHDPKDWAVVFHGDEDDSAACDEALMTKAAAELRSSGMGTAVRVRTTPAPVDTSRYIQLYRRAGTNEAWRINKLGDGRQEYTWAEADKKSDYYEYVNVKVRD